MVDYTFEQYMSAARNADAAGDGNAARRLVQAAKNLQQVSSDAKAEIVRRTDLPQIGPDPLVSGLGRGFKGLLELPELAGRAAYRGGQELFQLAGGEVKNEMPVLESKTGAALTRGAEALGINDALNYRGDTRGEKVIGSIGEFLSPAGAIGNLAKLTKTVTGGGKVSNALSRASDRASMTAAATAGAGSELAGQATEGKDIEPYARFAGAMVSPTIAARTANILVGKPYNTFIKPRALAKELNTGNEAVDKALANAFVNQNSKSSRILKNVSYKAADEAGDVFTQKDLINLFSKIDDNLHSGAGGTVRFDPAALSGDKHIQKALDAIFERTQSPSTSLMQLDNLRLSLRNIGAAGTEGAKKLDPRISSMVREIDDLIQTKAVGSPVLNVARLASMRTAKLEMMESILKGNKLQGPKAYVKALEDILENPSAVSYFNESEIKAMQAIVSGKIDEKILRGYSKLSPFGKDGAGSTASLALNLGLIGGGSYGAGVSGGLALGTVTAGSVIAKPISGAVVRSQIQDLKRAIAMSSPTSKLNLSTLPGAAAFPGQFTEDQQ